MATTPIGATEKMRQALRHLDEWKAINPPATWNGEYQYVVDLYGHLCCATIAMRAALAASPDPIPADMVMVPRDRVVIVTNDHGGYHTGQCIACGASGWIDQIKHKKDCPMLDAAPQQTKQKSTQND